MLLAPVLIAGRAGADTTGVLASTDPAWLLMPETVAGAPVLAAEAGTATSMFAVRRIPNPRYRPPASFAPALGTAVQSRLQALDFGRLQLARRGAGPATSSDWDLSGGQEAPNGDRHAFAATGASTREGAVIRTARFESRLGAFDAALGDVTPVRLLDPDALVSGLRGVGVRLSSPEHPRWSAALGGPTPVPGAHSGGVRLAAAGVSEIRYDIASLTATAVAFHRPALDAALGDVRDTLAGSGGAVAFAWRVPLPQGSLAGTLTGQMHDLDGRPVLANGEMLAWRLNSPRLLIDVRDQRTTPRFRRVAADRIAPEAAADTRWNVQARQAGGRLEWHAAGAHRSGGDALLAARTAQLGGSIGFGRSRWSAGADANWDDRGAGIERRLSAQVSRFVADAPSFNARFERASAPGNGARWVGTGEVLVPLRRGWRAALEPRAGWAGEGFDRASLGARLACPMTWGSGRLELSLAAGAERDRAFHPAIEEAGLAFAWVPRPRDRAGLEARRTGGAGSSSLELNASYDFQLERFLSPAAERADTGRVRVRVTRSGNGTGLGDILVTLDGREFRFTDADGFASFDRVPPGVHIVAVDEASLPRNDRVVGAARTFVTIESGRPVPPVAFTVARPERRSEF